MITTELQDLLNKYFEVLYTQNLELFDEVFFHECVLYTSQDDEVIARPIAEYRKIVQGRKSPQDLGSIRNDEIVTLDILSEEMAWAKVRLQLNENIMVDYLNLLKVNGKWTIAAKFYHRENLIHK